MSKRMALVKDGIVHDVVVASPQYEVPEGHVAIESEQANIGDTHNGETFLRAGPPRLDHAALIEYARKKREVVTRAFIEFNLAKPGDDYKIVRIPLNNEYRGDIIDLAYLAEHIGYNQELVLPDQTITLTPAQAMDLRHRMAMLVSHSHALLAKITAAIATGHIATQDQVDSPELATAIELPSWFLPHG